MLSESLKADSQYDANAAVNTYKCQVQGGLINSCVNVVASYCESVFTIYDSIKGISSPRGHATRDCQICDLSQAYTTRVSETFL